MTRTAPTPSAEGHPGGPVASRLSHLECSECGQRQPPEVVGACPGCGSPLLCRYEAGSGDPIGWPARGAGLFRWSALLPVRDPARRLSLGEGDTPCIPLPRLAAGLGLASLHVKDEGRQPTGSFKARGMAVALAAHAERGARSVTLPSAGNAAAAAAAHARLHGLACRVVLPAAATPTYRLEARLCGARVIAVSGDLGAAVDWVRDHPGGEGDHVLATFREPFRLEGKKTMGFELWEAFGEDLPDAVIFPTGGGVGVVAIAKAMDELREAGLLQAASPRLIAAQVDSCAPVVRAFDAGASAVEPWESTRRTLAEGLRVPRVGGGKLLLRALRDSGGGAVAVEEPALIEAIRRAAAADGLLLSAEGGVALAALVALRARGDLAGARVVVFNTASPYKVPETLQAAGTG